jgi:hypothetical protein
MDMLADTGLGFTREEANHNLDNNQRPDLMATNIVDGKSNSPERLRRWHDAKIGV